MKIYTKTGDRGTSQLFSGERRTKTDQVFYALGAVDETQAMLGLAKQFLPEAKPTKDDGATEETEQGEAGVVASKDFVKIEKLGAEFDEIMSRLFDVGSSIATPVDSSSKHKLNRVKFAESNVSTLETYIDQMDTELEPLKNFILPSGGKCAAHLHVARTISRRAERETTKLIDEDQVERNVGMYLNRLSDYLFTAARYIALLQNYPEAIYKKAKSETKE